MRNDWMVAGFGYGKNEILTPTGDSTSTTHGCEQQLSMLVLVTSYCEFSPLQYSVTNANMLLQAETKFTQPCFGKHALTIQQTDKETNKKNGQTDK